MRDIKFRIFDKKKQMMYETPVLHFTLCNEYNGTFGVGNPFNHTHTEIMQYTGLKDKNGRDVCEGDILIWEHNNFGPLMVRWNVDECMFEATDGYPSSCSILDDSCSVIGNIYENPELIIGDS